MYFSHINPQRNDQTAENNNESLNIGYLADVCVEEELAKQGNHNSVKYPLQKIQGDDTA